MLFALLFIACSSEDEVQDAGVQDLPQSEDDTSNDDGSSAGCDDTIWFYATSDAEREFEEVRFSFQYNNEKWWQDWYEWEDARSVTIGFRNVPDESYFRWSFEYDSDQTPGNGNESGPAWATPSGARTA